MSKMTLDELIATEQLRTLKALFSDQDKVREAIDFGKTEVEKAAAILRSEAKTISEKKLELLPKKRKKVHYKHKRKRIRANYRKYTVPYLKRRKAALLEGETWEMVEDYWKRTKTPYRITREEWMSAVDPFVRGRLFTINRYETKKPISVGNIVVYCRTSEEVLFDGKEHIMRSLGYML